jgi:hypothetical protein
MSAPPVHLNLQAQTGRCYLAMGNAHRQHNTTQTQTIDNNVFHKK